MTINAKSFLHVFNLGGTAGAGHYDPVDERVVVSEEAMDAPIQFLTTQRGRFQHVVHHPICCKQSTDITEEDRQSLLRGIIECGDREIMVLHGTKTISETHYFLVEADGFMKHIRHEKKRIVIVGSRTPLFFCSTDLPWTLAAAVTYLQYGEPNVVAVVHGNVYQVGTYTMGSDGFMERNM